MKMVVITSIVVRLTLSAASKRKAWKRWLQKWSSLKEQMGKMLSAFYLRVFFAWLLLFWPPYQTQNQLICCQLSWKEPYLDFGSYLDFQGSGRGFFYQDFVQQYQRGKPGHKCKVRAHLVIKGVSKKKIFTLELMCICLFHEKTVLLSFKQFSFITYSSPPLLSFPFLSTVTLVLHSQFSPSRVVSFRSMLS